MPYQACEEMNLENKHKVKLIKQLYGRVQLPVSELSKGINKSIPFTTTLITEMMEDGILEESGLARSRGGRRPQLYSIVEGIGFVVGVAVNQFKSTLTIFDLSGTQIIDVLDRNITLTKTGEDLVALGDFIAESIESSGIDPSRIIGVGIGMPGFVNVNKGQNHSFLKRLDSSLVEYLEERIRIPVFIDNDSSLIGLAELRQGIAREQGEALVINIGWGVGLGIIISHEVFRGENGYAGEFSHIPLYDNNKICSCGKVGCLETESSLNILIERARAGLASGVYTTLSDPLPEDKTEAVKLIFNAIQQGDTFSIGLLNQLGHSLGRGISILIHLFNPAVVVLSGLGSIAGKYWWAPVQQAINEYSIGKLAENTEIQISELGSSAELVGAAALVIERMEEIRMHQNRSVEEKKAP